MEKKFIDDDFMLESSYARELYHESAEKMPVIDYHCHLVPEQIATNCRFRDLTEVWLGGDHYKWRALRANGVPEEYITGNKPAWEKFLKWAETVPYTMRNPLYHWTHLELARVFGIYKLLNPDTAREIYDRCTEMLQTGEFRGQALMKKFNVETVCTTDDPADSLEWHAMMKQHPFGVNVFPAWRPDKVTAIENPASFTTYIHKLEEVSGKTISGYQDLLDVLQKRHDFFGTMGCRVSDHGLDTFYAEDSTPENADTIFRNALKGTAPDSKQAAVFKTQILADLAKMDCRSGWVQQFHVGPLRNNNRKMYELLGPDTGFDAIGDLPVAEAGHKFFSRLAYDGNLGKTILYNLNPKDTEVMAALAFTFNDGTGPGKIQYGAAWWFLDQEDGMRKQLNALSSFGLLSRFVGMLTDSRSFLSYPRHEYFRRILCNVLGEDIRTGRLPASEMPFIHQMVKDISYGNAKRYFGF